MDQQNTALADRFQQLLGSSMSGGEDEKLLELASNFSVQLSAAQVRTLIAVNMFADVLDSKGKIDQAKILRSFLKKYLDLKKYHGSDFYVMRALDSISLRKFMSQTPIGVDVIKK